VTDTPLEALNPVTLEVIGTVPDMDEAQVRQAVQRARAAFRTWSQLDFAERREQMLAVRDHMLDRLDDVVARVCEETGKTRFEAVVSEVLISSELIGYYARHGEKVLADSRVSAGILGPLKRAWTVYEPLGVVGVISPWNYPFTLTMTPVVTALFAGNTVVLKPSEITPLVGVLVGKIFSEGCDHPDVVQVVTGAASTGEHLVRSGLQKICFTGSVATGKKVMTAAADTLTPVLLELGGKDPMLVLDDADVERSSSGAVWGAFSNCGQTCIAVERAYVDAKVYDDFLGRVVMKTRAVRQGPDDGEDGRDIGSMTSPQQLEKVERHVADAVEKGARVLTGGRRRNDLKGLFYEPTVLVDVDHSMDVMREETFGPVLPVMRVAGEEEAVRLANDSAFGLNASVWTGSEERGRALAGLLEAGNVCINDSAVNYGVAALPFGGVKDSGIGRAHGPEGLVEMSRVKSVVEDRYGLRREIQWYPAARSSYAVSRRLTKVLYRRGAVNKLKALLKG
jgi:acyl-CoA reductase-like NAD-dependent aldehyde dehydrogenase